MGPNHAFGAGGASAAEAAIVCTMPPMSGTTVCTPYTPLKQAGDASQRSPAATSGGHACGSPQALTSWLYGDCGPLPSFVELAERLRAAAPETYED
jgi:hypothetical protein